jgi:hypothetical protein
MMNLKSLFSLALMGLMAASMVTPAFAKHHGHGTGHAYGHHNRYVNQQGYGYFPGYGNRRPSYYRDGVPFFQTTGGKIVKGTLIGAGIGAATGAVFDKPILKSTVIGGAVGAGVQALRYGRW